MDVNPELVAQGLTVGDTIKVPTQPTSGKTYFYWLKIECYVSGKEDEKHQVIEPYEIWKPGLYQTSKRIARLDKSPIEYVEVFEDEIPEVILAEIAKRYSVATEYVENGKRKIKPATEVLDILVVKK